MDWEIRKALKEKPLTRAAIQRACARVDIINRYSPEKAADEAKGLIPMAELAGPCAVAMTHGVLGAAYRRLNKNAQAEEAYTDALAACRCAQCLPRTQRRLAVLRLSQDDLLGGLDLATGAVEQLRQGSDKVETGLALTALAEARGRLGDLAESIAAAREALCLIPKTDPRAPAIAQILAHQLTRSNCPEDWAEIHALLADISAALETHNSGDFRLLKQHLGWLRVLAEHQAGVGRNHAERLYRIADTLSGLGAGTVPRHAVDDALRRAKKARTPETIAALAADLVLLDYSRPSRIVILAELAAKLSPKGSPLLAPLGELARICRAKAEAKPAALAVRRLCSGAPALPPCLLPVSDA